MEKPQKPNNYLIPAIISTIFCCQITGIISIIYAAQVNSQYAEGKYEAANKSAANAKMWFYIGLALGIVILISMLAIYGIAFFSILTGNGDF